MGTESTVTALLAAANAAAHAQSDQDCRAASAAMAQKFVGEVDFAGSNRAITAIREATAGMRPVDVLNACLYILGSSAAAHRTAPKHVAGAYAYLIGHVMWNTIQKMEGKS